MSDNISPKEIEKRLVLFLRIPAEIWTDVLKLFSRRILVLKIAPACYRLKDICDRNVKNVHVIEKATQFTKKLENDDPEANQQLENLTANECQLAGQFKFSEVRIGEKSQAILRDCPDLFKGCQIILVFKEENKKSKLFLECLNQLEGAKPTEIIASQRVDQNIDYWHHPTFQNCTRVDLSFFSGLSTATLMKIFVWLHHLPNGVDCDASADQQVRCMIIWGIGQNHIDWLINRCAEDIQQSRKPADRHPFVLNFFCCFSTGFGQFRRIENKWTGEVLVLERVLNGNGQPTDKYRLRRCMAEEEAGGEDFYAGLFKRDKGFEEFNIDESKPKVTIH